MPGWGIAAVLLYLAYLWGYLSFAVSLALFGAWVVIELLFYPVVRVAYEPADPDPSAALVGRVGVVERAVPPPGARGSEPVGYVRLGAELWRAHATPGCDDLSPGARVTVRRVDGLVLTVSATLESDKD